jgi:outer membrane biogenesis lipoprotein LolB
MSKDQIKEWLLERSDVISIRAIGMKLSIPNLARWVRGEKDGRGYEFTLPDKHLPSLCKEIDRIRK